MEMNMRIYEFERDEHDMNDYENLMICHLKLGVRKDTLMLQPLIPKRSLHIERTVLLRG